MSDQKNDVSFSGSAYPLAVSLFMIVGAVVLSFVDLTFLNDVIGKVLDFGSLESMAVAFVLGLVGLGIMAHQGVKSAHGIEKFRNVIGFNLLWILLGVAFVLVRLFSATIMQLDNSLGDQSLIKIVGLNVREVDLVLAPLMFILYLATGLLVKDGIKNLLLNPEYYNWREARREAREAKRTAEDKRRANAERKMARFQAEAEKKRQQREKEIEEARQKEKLDRENDRVKNAANGTYSNALAQYRSKEKEIKEKYQKISSNIDFIKSMDKQERDFETKAKPDLLRITRASVRSAQNSVALAMRNKTGEDISSLRQVIEIHNNNHDHEIGNTAFITQEALRVQPSSQGSRIPRTSLPIHVDPDDNNKKNHGSRLVQ